MPSKRRKKGKKEERQEWMQYINRYGTFCQSQLGFGRTNFCFTSLRSATYVRFICDCTEGLTWFRMTLVTREGFIMTVYLESVVVTVVSSRRACQTYRSDWWPEPREKNREQETLKSTVSKSIQNYSYKKSGEKRALKYFIGTWSVKSRNYPAGPLIKSAPLLLRGIFTFLDRALYPSRQVHLNVTSATWEEWVMSQ